MTAALEIDLAAFDANIAAVQARVSPAEPMLVVKDDAYGHGAVPLVRRAVAAGIRWIGAYDIETARAVRAAVGGRVRIFVWTFPSVDEVAAAVDLHLDLGIGDREVLEDVARVGAERSARVHLKIDTGLHRNGFRPEDWPAAVRQARQLELDGTARVVGIWSHIAEASDADDDAARAVFDLARREAVEAGLGPSIHHLAASAASFARRAFRYDLVRVGAYAYGVAPAGGPSGADLGLVPIARLIATVTAIARDEVVVDTGAFDGLFSTLAGRTSVGTPAGPRALLRVGHTESAVAAWPGAAIGDTVVIYGPGTRGEPTATGLAELIDTIGEEIVTRVSPDLPRRYVEGRA
ncbi:alanine racemase [Microbacterium sp. Marseille-Q6648]|uniref:alanine racemase n=1 Tax=Microbacterium sp. Marseille-Q6648 TaxID=2937991 RepID=UPI00203B3EB8|nr:alanine racemase [Microbacterium sp. Marseille-Q6648]